MRLRLSSAEESIDAIHVNFSADMICMLNLIAPDTCTYENNALPWMRSVVEAVQKNHVKVRVIVENANSNGLENRVGIDMLYKELARLGLSELVEVRFYNGRVHMKTALIDHQLLFVGSQNFHYSSFASAGLLEFVAATDSQAAIDEYQKMFDYYWAAVHPGRGSRLGHDRLDREKPGHPLHAMRMWLNHGRKNHKEPP